MCLRSTVADCSNTLVAVTLTGPPADGIMRRIRLVMSIAGEVMPQGRCEFRTNANENVAFLLFWLASDTLVGSATTRRAGLIFRRCSYNHGKISAPS